MGHQTTSQTDHDIRRLHAAEQRPARRAGQGFREPAALEAESPATRFRIAARLAARNLGCSFEPGWRQAGAAHLRESPDGVRLRGSIAARAARDTIASSLAAHHEVRMSSAVPVQHRQLYIDGQWVDSASGKKIGVENPATEEIIAEVSAGGKADCAKAVAAASEA